MMRSISKKVYVIAALILVLVVGCRQIWNAPESTPKLPEYNITLDDVPVIKVDSTYEISVVPNNSEIDIVSIQWSSDDNSVVTVSPVDGTNSAILTAISSSPKNSAIITVTTTDQEGNTKSEKVEVLTYSEVETLSLSGPTVVVVGDTPVLTVDITPESAQTAPLIWSRTGEIALDINAESGDITTKAPGISNITVAADDTSGKTDSHDMVVVDFPKEIPPGVILGPDGSVMPSNPTSAGAVWIPIGKHITLPSPAPLGSEFQNLLAAGTPKWVSADETYVSVAADTPGKLNGVKAEGGEFPIKVTLTTEYTYDELGHTLTAEYPVYVADPSIGVTSSTGELSRAPSVTVEAGIPSIEVEVDTTRDLSMFLHTDIPGLTFSNVLWESDNPSHVVVVDNKNGIIKGIKSSAIITATDQDTKLTAQIEVKVTGAGPDAIEIVSDSGELVLPVNKNSLPVSLVFEPEGTESAVSWDISDENLATIVDGGSKGVVVSNDAGKTGAAIVVVTSEINPEVKGLLDVTVYDIIIDGTTGIDDNTGSTELTVKVIPENDKTAGVDLSTLGTITWSIDQGASIASLKVDESDPRKVTVSAKPEEIATRALRGEKSPSVVKISVLTGNGLKTNVDVYINPLYVDSVSITPPATPPEGAELVDDSTLIINTKSGFVLGTELDPVEASNTSIAWSVEPEGILSVQGGSVNSLGPLGTATVTATAKGAKDGEIKESHFIVKVRDFELKYGKSYIPVGAEGETLTGAMLPSSSYGTLDLGEWKSTSPGKLEIDADTGELTPKSGGTVEITATDATTGLTQSYEIIVAELTGLIGQSTIEQGSQTTLDHSVKGITKDDLGELTWTSEDPSVAVIDMTSGSPMVKGVGAGTTTLTVTDNAGLTATVEVTVTNIVAEGVSINEDVATLAVGSSSTYTATTSPETLTTNGVVWSLEEETPAEEGTTVGTIDKNGKFVAKNPGTVTIVVTTKDSVGTENPITDKITVTVQGFIANPKEIVIKKGEVVSLGYEIIPEGTADVGTFSGYNTEVVKVDAGEVTGLSAGTTTITAVDDVTGLSAKTKVTVWDIEIQGASTLAKGASSEYTLVKKPTNEVIASSGEAKISWDIPEFNYAWVDEAGKVTAEAKPAAPAAPATRANIANVKLMARYEGLTAEHPIAIDGVDVTGIAITSTVKEVNVDKSITITAEVTPSHASEKGIEWSLAAGDEEFATINSTTGVLRGKAPGYVTVTAKAKGAPEGKELIAQEDVTVLALDISVPNRVQVPDSFTIGVTTQPTKQAPTMEGWKSSDESVATVDENGNVKTVKPGITTITATDSSTGMVIEYELVVYGLKVEGLPELTAGATSTYTAVLQPLSNPEGLTLGTVSWSVTSGEISGGDFTAPLVPGEVTITATDTDNNIAGTLVVKIIDKKVSDIEIINERDINITEKFQLEIELTPEDATNQKVTWESSAPDVVEVTQKGVISGKKAGTADITVTALGGAEGETVSDKVSIMVRDFAISLKEEDKNIFVKEEATVQVELKPEDYGSDLTWGPENSEIVSVAGGIITGKSMGTATIEAIDGTTGLKRSVAITISDIEIQGETQSLVKGESTDLKLVKIPGGSEITSTTEDPINWSVSNSNIAWVDKDGVVRAESKPVEPSTPATLQAMTLEGETEPSGDENVVTVYAKYKGLTAKYVMNITPMYVTDIQITPEESVLVNVGESVQLNAVVTPENASNLGVGWSIDPSQYAIATVDEKGKVTGLSPGSVTVKATAKGGSVAGEPSTTKEVTVRDIALKSPKNYVLAGSDFAPVVSILPFENVSADMGDWTASPEDTLRYNEETGKFEALKGGSATITGTDATTGLTRTFDINIAQLKVTGPATIEQGKESSNFSVSLIKGNADIDLGTVNWSADPSNGVEIIPAESGNTMKVKGLVPGEVTITATDSNGITGTATIEVTYVPVTSITLEGEDGADKVSVNNSINLTATVLPENATTQGVTWSIKEGGEDIASVSQNGKVTGKQVGKVTVLATSKSEGTVVGEYEVTVRDLEVTVDKSEIYKGETATITAKILPENSGDANITKWEPTNENGEVSGSATSATVEGKSSGYLTITVTDGETGRSKPVKITISDIEIRGKIANVPAGGELQLELWKVPGNEKIESGVSWEVNPSSVATIDGSTGKLTASTDSASAGQGAVVTARLEGTNLSTTYDVTVEGIDVTDITIEEPTTILVGSTVQLNATITPANASNKKVRWETAADPAVAEVTSEGKIIGYQAGTIKVKAIAVGDETIIAETFITIRDLELGIIERANVGQTVHPAPVIKPKNEKANIIKWSSSNTSVATIDPDTGEITTKEGGFTTITGTHKETNSEGNDVEITQKETLNVTQLKLTPKEKTITQGDSTEITVTLESGTLGLDLGKVNWSTTPTGIIEIDDSSGKIVATGKAPGEVTIQGVDANGVTGITTLIVTKQDVTSIVITGNTKYINLGTDETLQLSAEVMPAHASNKDVNWSITKQTPVVEGEEVATISKTGEVTGINPGTVTVTATALGSKDGTLTATYEVVVRKLVIETASQTVNVSKDPFSIVAKYIPEKSGTPEITLWQPSQPEGDGEVVGVSFTQKDSSVSVVAKRAGEVSITATDITGMTSSIRITVQDLIIIGDPTVYEGRTIQLEAQLRPSGKIVTSDTTWSTGNHDKAWANNSDQPGLITAAPKPDNLLRSSVNNGVVVRAMYNGLIATHTLTITDSPAKDVVITVPGFSSDDKAMVSVGGTLQLSAEVLPVYATDKSVTWSIDDSTNKFATIDAKSGLVTGVSSGFIQVKATANGSEDGKPEVVATRGVYITELEFITTPRKWITADGHVNTTNLQVRLNPQSLGITPEIVWSDQYDKSVLEIDGSGKVTAGTTPGTVMFTGRDKLTNQTISHEVSLVDLKVSVKDGDWVAKGQTKELEIKLLPTTLPQAVTDEITLSLDIKAPGSTNEISILENKDTGVFSIKGLSENEEGKTATVSVFDDTTGLSVEKEVTVVTLTKVDNAKSWVAVDNTINLSEYIKIIPESSGVTPNMSWTLVDASNSTYLTVESDGSVTAQDTYSPSKVSIKGEDSKTGHAVEYRLDVVDIVMVNPPKALSSKNGKAQLDAVIMPKTSGLIAQNSWSLVGNSTVIDITTEGLVTATGEHGTAYVRVDDAVTGLNKIHHIDVVDFSLSQTGESKPYIYTGDNINLEAVLTTPDGQDPLDLSLQWSAIPEGYVSIEKTGDLTAKIVGIRPHSDVDGVTIQAKDISTGLTATYPLSIVGIRFKENQPLWMPINKQEKLEVEFVPAQFTGNSTLTWSIDDNSPSGTVIHPTGAPGAANLTGGKSGGYTTVTVSTTSTSGVTLNATHTMTIAELLIDRGENYLIPITTSATRPNRVKFSAWINPAIPDQAEITWTLEPKGQGASDSTIDKTSGVVTAGSMYGNADIWASATVGDHQLTAKLDLTVMSFVLEQASKKPYIASGNEGYFKPIVKPQSAVSVHGYELSGLDWSITNEAGEDSWLAVFSEDKLPSDKGATIKARQIPGKVLLTVFHGDTGITIKQPVYVATIDTKKSPSWTPVTSGSNYKNLVAEILPAELTGGDDPIIQIPQFVWEVLEPNETSDPGQFSGKASIVGSAKSQIKGDSYGKVQLKVSVNDGGEFTGLATTHDVWTVEFLFEGDKPNFLTVDGNFDSTTLIPSVRPVDSGVTPEVGSWTNSAPNSISLNEEYGILKGLKNHKGVTITAVDKTTGESASYTVPVLEYEILEDGAVGPGEAAWISWNKGTRTFTGRYLPEGIDISALGITSDIVWTENSPYAGIAKDKEFTGVVTTESVDTATTHPSEGTGSFVITSRDKTTGLSDTREGVVGALIIEGETIANKGVKTALEALRYPEEYGDPVNSTWSSSDDSHIEVEQQDKNTARILSVEYAAMEQDTSISGVENWYIPKGIVTVIDNHTGLTSTHNIQVAPDAMHIRVKASNNLWIPVDNTNILIDTDGDGYYAKNNPRYKFSPVGPNTEIVITELNDTIKLGSWRYNKAEGRTVSPMKDALIDVTQWGHADFTDAQHAFREYTALKEFTATDSPILGGNLSYMFFNNNVFTGLGLQYWDVSEVTHMNEMFREADGLTGLYEGEDGELNQNVFTGWKVGNVVSARRMFQQTDNYTANYMSDLSWDSLKFGDYMFANSPGVVGEHMNNWKFEVLNNYVGNRDDLAGITRIFEGSNNYTGANSTNWYIKVNNWRGLYQMFPGNNTHFAQNPSYLINWTIHLYDDTNTYEQMFNSIFSNNKDQFTFEGLRGWTIISDKRDSTQGTGPFREMRGLTGKDMAGWSWPGIINANDFFVSEKAAFLKRNLTGEGMEGWTFPDATSMANLFDSTQRFNGPVETWNIGTEGGTNFEGMNLANMFRYTQINRDLSEWDVSGASNKGGMFTNTPMASNTDFHPIGY